MFDSILSIINKFIPDPDKARSLAVDMEREVSKQMELQSEVIKREIDQGGITAKWRPYTMMLFVGMVVAHFIMYDVVPFIRTTFELNFWVPEDPGFTEGLLPLIKLGLGGYIGGRTVEKVAHIWKK